MGARTSYSGSGVAGKHGSVTDGAKAVIESLRRQCQNIRIRMGFIQGHVQARVFSIKIATDSHAHKMVVLCNGGKQEFYLYSAPPLEEVVTLLRKDKRLRAYEISVIRREEA